MNEEDSHVLEAIPDRQYRWLIALACIAALFLRIGVVAKFQGISAPPDVEAQPDQVDYHQFAKSLARGEGYVLADGRPSARRPPGTSLTLVPAFALCRDSDLAARLWVCLLSAATCGLAAVAAHFAFGRLTTVLTAWGLAFCPDHFYYALHFVSEGPFAFFTAAGSAFAVLLVRPSFMPGIATAAGASLAAAVLTRPQSMFVLPLAWLLLLIRFRAGLDRRLAANLLVVSLACAAVLFPWLLRNALVMGKPMLSSVTGGYAFWGAHNELTFTDPEVAGSWVRASDLAALDRESLPRDELEADRVGWKKGWSAVRAHWTRVPWLEAQKLWRLVSPFSETPNRAVYWAFALSWIGTAPLLVGGIVCAWRRSRMECLALLLPVLSLVLTCLIFYGSDRFRHSVAPLYVLFAAHGAAQLLNRLGFFIGSPETSLTTPALPSPPASPPPSAPPAPPGS